MGELPEFVKRFKFYHSDVPDMLKRISKKKVASKDARALVAKSVLLHKVEHDLDMVSELKRLSSGVTMERRTARRGIRIRIGGVTAMRIERVDGLRVEVVARRRRGMLSVKVTNIGEKTATIAKLRAGRSEAANLVVLPVTNGLRRWVGLRCELNVEVNVERTHDGGCVTFEVS